jgi:hypothetical protein
MGNAHGVMGNGRVGRIRPIPKQFIEGYAAPRERGYVVDRRRRSLLCEISPARGMGSRDLLFATPRSTIQTSPARPQGSLESLHACA